MGKAFSHPEYMHDPNVTGAAGQDGQLGSGYLGLEDWARQLGLGRAGESAKEVLQQMNKGNYQGLAGTLLSPIHDRYAANEREAERNAMMGANAMYAGTQPALMAGLQDTMRKQMAEGEGLAYGQAIPSLWSTTGNMFQGALNALEGNQLSGLADAAKLRQGQLVNQPGWLDRVGQVAGLAQGIAAPFGGFGALGGLFGGGGSGGSPPTTQSFPASSPFYPNPEVPPLSGTVPFNPGSFAPPPYP